MDLGKVIEQMLTTQPLVLFAAALLVFSVFLVLMTGTFNAAAQKLLQRVPGGKKNLQPQTVVDAHPTLQAIGNLTTAQMQLVSIIQETNSAYKEFVTYAKEQSVINKERHDELIILFAKNETQMQARHEQIATLTVRFSNAVDMMGAVAAGLAKNNETVGALVAAQEKSFAIREKATADINDRMQSMSLSLQGVNRTVGVVGTTMVDMGGSLEDINLLLKALTEKVERVQQANNRLENDMRSIKGDMELLIASIKPVAMIAQSVTTIDQSQIKTATLPPTTPLVPKESSDVPVPKNDEGKTGTQPGTP